MREVTALGRFTLSGVCRALGVSRQALYRKRGERMRFYRRREDEAVLEEIKAIVEKRSTYGYKRITAMVNKDRAVRKEPPLNKKRVYRLMRMNGLLLPKSGIAREKRQRTGKIMVLQSNTRWCSDIFEIRCWNAERVFVAFSLDCKDREAIATIASKQPLLARDIQGLMIQSVEKRFKGTKAPRPIQWLTDRGAVYRAIETQHIARSLGLRPCFTAPYSPESNGMAEAFVGTFKRDYVYTNDCVSADWVLNQLPEWFEDYNIQAPHSALGMKSPVDYQKLILEGVN